MDDNIAVCTDSKGCKYEHSGYSKYTPIERHEINLISENDNYVVDETSNIFDYDYMLNDKYEIDEVENKFIDNSIENQFIDNSKVRIVPIIKQDIKSNINNMISSRTVKRRGISNSGRKTHISTVLGDKPNETSFKFQRGRGILNNKKVFAQSIPTELPKPGTEIQQPTPADKPLAKEEIKVPVDEKPAFNMRNVPYGPLTREFYPPQPYGPLNYEYYNFPPPGTSNTYMWALIGGVIILAVILSKK